MADRAVIDEVRQRTDIVQVVSEYVALKKRGKDYWGLCPFHHETTPSFHVLPDKQLFYCFGCQKGGTVFTFLQLRENLSFPEALRMLAERAGVALDEHDNPAAAQRRRQASLAQEALQLAARFFQYHLQQGTGAAEARRYLAGRGLSDASIQQFGLGYAPNSWDALQRALTRRGIRPEVLVQLGLIVSREGRGGYYDRFRHRIMFPIWDVRGRVIGFGGRALDAGQQPKYLNSPESAWFSKGRHLYGLHLAKEAMRQADQAIIVEGYMDAIACHQAGLGNVVASMGTALTAEQGRLLLQQTKNVVIAFDADAAGANATLRGLDILAGLGCRLRVLRLDPGAGQTAKDPDEFLKAHGADAFRQALDAAPSLVDYRLQVARAGVDPATPQGKSDIVRRSLEVLVAIPDAVERDAYAQRLAETLQIRLDVILQELRRFRRNQHKPPAHNGGKSWHNTTVVDSASPSINLPQTSLPPNVVRAQRDLVALMLQKPQWITATRAQVPLEWFQAPGLAPIVERLYAAGEAPTDGAGIDQLATELAAAGADEALRTLSELVSCGTLPEEVPRLQHHASDCIKILRKHTMVQRIRDLERTIAELEQQGRDPTEMALELYRLRKSLG